MQSNEVKRFKKFVKDIIEDYWMLLACSAILCMCVNLILVLTMGKHFIHNDVVYPIVVLVGLSMPYIGVVWLWDEYKIENSIKDDDY